MDFRTRLREEIDFSGLLDKEVAARANISKRTIDSYVGSQNCMPSADVAVRLAKVLNTTVNADMTESFIKQTVKVAGADNDTSSKYAKDYNVWVYTPAEAYGSTAALTITLG